MVRYVEGHNLILPVWFPVANSDYRKWGARDSPRSGVLPAFAWRARGDLSRRSWLMSRGLQRVEMHDSSYNKPEVVQSVSKDLACRQDSNNLVETEFCHVTTDSLWACCRNPLPF